MPSAERAAAAEERRIVCHEHRGLEPLMTRLEHTADLVGMLPAVELAGALRSLVDLVEKTLLPHIAWEERFCYPEIERLAGTPWATRYLHLQHAQLRRGVDRLEADWLLLRETPDRRAVLSLRGHLHEFHAQLWSHVEQEEQVLLPLLDAERAADAAPVPAVPGT